MCYQVGFCFWLLSFDQDIAEEINKYVNATSFIHIRLIAMTFQEVRYYTRPH